MRSAIGGASVPFAGGIGDFYISGKEGAGIAPDAVRDSRAGVGCRDVAGDPNMSNGGPVPTDRTTVHPSHSQAQLDAEPLMIAAVGMTIGVTLSKKRLALGEVFCEVDGVSEDEGVLVEAFAHQGAMKGGRLKKVSEDSLKLITLARTRPGARLIVAFADERPPRASWAGAGKPKRSGCWASRSSSSSWRLAHATGSAPRRSSSTADRTTSSPAPPADQGIPVIVRRSTIPGSARQPELLPSRSGRPDRCAAAPAWRSARTPRTQAGWTRDRTIEEREQWTDQHGRAPDLGAAGHERACAAEHPSRMPPSIRSEMSPRIVSVGF